MIDPFLYFWLFLKATLLTTGGLGSLPSLEQDLVSRHWATDADFGTALAVGQIAPGPTGLWVTSLGYLTFGWVGAVLATVAAVLPPLLILPVERLHRRFGDLSLVSDFIRGLGLAVVGVFPVVMLRLVYGGGFDLRSTAIVAGSFGLVSTRRVPPIAVLALAFAAGVLAFR